jgi:hypothetical protein
MPRAGFEPASPESKRPYTSRQLGSAIYLLRNYILIRIHAHCLILIEASILHAHISKLETNNLFVYYFTLRATILIPGDKLESSYNNNRERATLNDSLLYSGTATNSACYNNQSDVSIHFSRSKRPNTYMVDAFKQKRSI